MLPRALVMRFRNLKAFLASTSGRGNGSAEGNFANVFFDGPFGARAGREKYGFPRAARAEPSPEGSFTMTEPSIT